MTISKEGLLDQKKRMTPNEYAQMLRSHGPIFYWETNGIWVVTDYELAKEILRNPDFSANRTSFFISRMPNLDLHLIQDFLGSVGKMMVMSDAPEHTSRRKVAATGLNETLIDRYRYLVDDIVRDLILTAEQKGYIEFVEDLAQPLPSAILADLFKIPITERKAFYLWSNNMTEFFGGASQYRNEDGREVNQSTVALRSYFERLIKDRKEKPQDDFLSTMLSHQEKHSLEDGELISQAMMMLVAGSVTTTDQLCNNMFTLLTEPTVLEDMKNDLTLLPTAMEELNRFDPGVSYLFRVVSRDTQLQEYSFHTGDTVFISNHAINRDPKLFPNPEFCNIRRQPNPHFAYGHGAHYCMGARLARIQMMSLFGQLLSRFPNLRLNRQRLFERRHYSLAFSGFAKLYLEI